VELGWRAAGQRLRSELRRANRVVCVECYPGGFVEEIEQGLSESLRPALVIRAAAGLRSPDELGEMFAAVLTDDPVVGRMNSVEIADFFDPRPRGGRQMHNPAARSFEE
jgi:hypothetical protein